jgi:hypothetical protein
MKPQKRERTITYEYWDCGDPQHNSIKHEHLTKEAALRCIKARENRAARERKIAEKKARVAVYLDLYDKKVPAKEAAETLGVSAETFRRRAKHLAQSRIIKRLKKYDIPHKWSVPDPMMEEIRQANDSEWARIENEWIARAQEWNALKEWEEERARRDAWGSFGDVGDELDTGDHVMRLRGMGTRIDEIAHRLGITQSEVLILISERLARARTLEDAGKA